MKKERERERERGVRGVGGRWRTMDEDNRACVIVESNRIESADNVEWKHEISRVKSEVGASVRDPASSVIIRCIGGSLEHVNMYTSSLSQCNLCFFPSFALSSPSFGRCWCFFVIPSLPPSSSSLLLLLLFCLSPYATQKKTEASRKRPLRMHTIFLYFLSSLFKKLREREREREV